jgi:type IV fimbrial biogenesis protein FimT
MPSFTPMIERWRVRQAAEALQSSIYYARSEAIKRSGGISIVASGGDWGGGWTVQYTINGTTTDLQTTPAPNKISLTQANSTSTIYLDRWGMMAASVGGVGALMEFVIFPSDKSASATTASRLCAGQGGRIKILAASDSCS